MKLATLFLLPLAATFTFAQAPGRNAGTERHADAENGADVRVHLTDAKGGSVGTATIVETPHGLLVRYTSFNLPAGLHAIHLHETGRCDAPSFESAGGHFNPTKAAHGFGSANGYHAGDMPNIHVSPGRESHELFVNGVKLRTGRMLLDADGAALVVHAGRDDHLSDPAGEAGDRIACGVIAGR